MPTLPSTQQFGAVGSGIGDIFAGFGDLEKEQGAAFEAQAYTEAAQLAGQEAQFTAQSTRIQQVQAERSLFMAQGKTKANLAGAGLAQEGTGLNILRSSAAQGAMQTAVVGQQGLITQAGYEEQQQSYTAMANVAKTAESADTLAAVGSFVGAGISFASFGAVPAAPPAPA